MKIVSVNASKLVNVFVVREALKLLQIFKRALKINESIVLSSNPSCYNTTPGGCSHQTNGSCYK